LPHPVVLQELRLLEDVKRALAEEPGRDDAAEESIVRELERVRALLLSGEEQKDRLALLEQWDRGSALLRQLRASRATPRVNRSSPYFAHMRLLEDGRERDVCLGRATCIRRGVRIVDWRNAPISRLFYRYRQGEPYEEELAGRIVSGEVAARRTVAIRGGALERVDAPEGSWIRAPGGAAAAAEADEAWRQVAERAPRLSGGAGTALRARSAAPGSRRLGTDPSGAAQRADKHLPEIAGLLDPSQFDLISRPGPGCLVVRGSAGSGKTTVALHRIAYLAYDDPAIDSPETVFLTLSPALCDYVSTLLPSLGVGRVRVETFPEWAARYRRRLFPRLPTTHRIDTPDSVRRVKQHPAIGRVLEAQVARVPGAADVEQALDDWASALTDAALLGALLDPPLASGDLHAAVDWCRVRQEELFAFLEGDEEAIAEIDAEDDALLLRAWQLRVGSIPAGEPRPGGPPSPSSAAPLRYRHIAVDEAQDWATIELRVVADCLGKPASITLAGDPHQRIANPFAAASWESLAGELGLPSAEVETLRITYRSTAEIMGFARSVLGPLWEDDAPPRAVRSGPPVEVFGFADSGACVAFLADALRQLVREEPLASVAILAPDAEQAALYYDGLETSEVPRLRRVESGRFAFAPGIEVAEIEQAKGLEFDYVVLVDVSAAAFPDSPRSRRLLHVGATRAIHQLWVTHAGPGSRLFEV